MMAAALLGLTRPNEVSHRLKYFVHPAQVPVDEVVAVDFEEPVIPFILVLHPVPRIFVALLTLIFNLGLLFVGFESFGPTLLLGWQGRQILLFLLEILIVLVRKESQAMVVARVAYQICEFYFLLLALKIHFSW